MALYGSRPEWLTFDCYGTLIQWDEGVIAAIRHILDRHERADIAIPELLADYDEREHKLEQSVPFKKFREVVAMSLMESLKAFNVQSDLDDVEALVSRISTMPPFPEVVESLKMLKTLGYKLCIVSNAEDSIIAGNVAQLAGTIDRVITAEQAEAYKPSQTIFNYAYSQLGVDASKVVHICASPVLDLAAARDLGFRCVWIDRNTGRRPPSDYVPNVILPNLHAVPHVLSSMGW